MEKSWNWIDGKNFYVVVAAILAVVVIGRLGGLLEEKSVVMLAAENRINRYPGNLWKGVIGEAVGEGYQGMYAVTCAYRNRLNKNLPLGCVALKRKDLDQFVEKQGKKYQEMAQQIVRKVFEENSPDITKGATHYENIEKFGIPRWAKKMEVTVRIGRHTFFREKTG